MCVSLTSRDDYAFQLDYSCPITDKMGRRWAFLQLSAPNLAAGSLLIRMRPQRILAGQVVEVERQATIIGIMTLENLHAIYTLC